jgi:ribose transport system substrate-binding protein
MKRVTVVLLAVLIMLTSLTSTFAQAKKPRMGLAMINLEAPFFANMMTAGAIAAKDYGIDLIWKSAEGSLEKQIAIVENFVQEKVDVIMIDPIDKKAIAPVVIKVHNAGIPVITGGNLVDTPYNINTLYNDYKDYFTLTDIMAHYINKKGNVVLIVGNPGNFVSDERQRGFEESVKRYPNIKVLSIQPSDWEAVKGMKAMENWLAAYPKIDAFMSVSDTPFMGALEPIRNSGREKEIALFGYDGDPPVMELIKKGEVVADLMTGSKRVGYWNVAVGAMLAQGKKIPRLIYLPTHFILKKETAKLLQSRGLDMSKIDWVEPDEGLRLWERAEEELGPGKLKY